MSDLSRIIDGLHALAHTCPQFAGLCHNAIESLAESQRDLRDTKRALEEAQAARDRLLDDVGRAKERETKANETAEWWMNRNTEAVHRADQLQARLAAAEELILVWRYISNMTSAPVCQIYSFAAHDLERALSSSPTSAVAGEAK